MKEDKDNKTIYVNKYDYMHYYTRCEPVWFLSNREIDKLMQKIEKPLKQQLGISDDSDEDEEAEDNLTTYEAFKEAKLNGTLNDLKIINEPDPKIIEGLIIDQKVKEFIINYFAKQVLDDYICIIDYDEINSSQEQCNINNLSKDNADIDLTRACQAKNDIEKLIGANKKFILFQPTFINETPDKHAKYVTRCDCIVYLNKNQCYLIEVKGTSSSKLIHFLDLYYQKKVLENSNLHITNYYLCLVKYARSDKKEIPFIIDPFIHTSKNNSKLSDTKENYIDLMLNHAFSEQDPKEFKKKLGNIDGIVTNWKQDYKLGKEHLLINDALNNCFNLDLISVNYMLKGASLSKAFNFATNFINNSKDKINPLINNFDNVINELSHKKNIHQKVNELFLKPCSNCTSCYKDCEFWNRCKKIFKYQYWTGDKELLPFGYCADIFNKKMEPNNPIDTDKNSYCTDTANEEINQFEIYERIKTDNPNTKINVNDINSIATIVKPDFLPFFKGQDNDQYMKNVKALWDKLQSRPNRVYFDFESINSAIPVMNHVFPLTQVITQNSVIKTEIRGDNHYYEYENELGSEINKKAQVKKASLLFEENNMIRDPTKLNVGWLKSIVDKLIDTKHKVDAKHPCTTWYIVYNQTFESNRLHEMDLVIKEKEYHDKIELIRNNIFDLADFFNTKQNEKKLLISKLHGFYSIKDVLPLIPQSIRDETKTVDYHKDLVDIHNGQQAQQITTKRFLNLFNDLLFKDKNKELMSKKEWDKVAKELQKYCENDVRSMIAVEKFIKQEFIDKLPKD